MESPHWNNFYFFFPEGLQTMKKTPSLVEDKCEEDGAGREELLWSDLNAPFSILPGRVGGRLRSQE